VVQVQRRIANARVLLGAIDGIRGMGGSDESAAAAGALRKGCGPMTMRY